MGLRRHQEANAPPKAVDLKKHNIPNNPSNFKIRKLRNHKKSNGESVWQIDALYDAPTLSTEEKTLICEKAIRDHMNKKRHRVPVIFSDKNGKRKQYFNTEVAAWDAFHELCKQKGWDPSMPERPDDTKSKQEHIEILLPQTTFSNPEAVPEEGATTSSSTQDTSETEEAEDPSTTNSK